MSGAVPRRAAALGPLALLAVAGLLLILLLQERYHHRILTLTLVWATMGLAWNIISGYAGQISFGHQAFFGIGAYLTVLLVIRLGLTPWIGMLIGGAAAVAAAALIGFPTFRLAGIYFALATLAYPLIFRIVMDFLGYQEVAIPMIRERAALFMQFTDPRAYDLLVLGTFLATFALSEAIERSRLGYWLRALKENEPAAEAMGVDTFRCKMTAYMLSAAPAAVIGAIYAHAVLFVVTPDAVFGLLVIVQTLVVCLVGGAGSKWGPVLGAVIMVPLGETLDATLGDRFPGIQGVIFGAALVLVMLFAPEGLYWRLRGLLASRRAAPEAAQPTGAPRAAPAGPRRAAGDGEALLEARGVSKAFMGLRALEDVSFALREGEILGIIGPNGAGKTTLFNVLNGFLLPETGEIRHRRQRITGLPPNAICRRGVGRTFQVARAFPRLTVLENVMVGAFVHEAAEPAARARAASALALVGLEARADRLPTGLTTLELRLMELARCTATAPELVLLDEPLAGLGRDGVEVMMDHIRRLRAEGITVAIIEHTMYALVRLADRVIVLDHGRLIAQGPPAEATRDPAVIEAYLGKRWLRHVEGLRA